MFSPIDEPWKPALSVDFRGHRSRVTAGVIRFAKSRLVMPIVRWLFEYAQENFGGVPTVRCEDAAHCRHGDE